jgi:DNA-binding Lrp family transcriptional regulator
MKKRVMTDQSVSVVRFENNKIPEFKEVRGKDWIQYGEKNDYPEYLLRLFNRSAKHNAIITGKVHYIKGNGFSWEPNTVINGFIENINQADSINDLLYKVATDLEIFNGFYLHIIPDNVGRLLEINHVDFSKMRIHKDKNRFLYSNDWSKYRQSPEETGLKILEPFNKKTNSGIVFHKQYRPGNNVYPIPEYIGCIPYIETDYEISNYHVNNVKNGFVGGTMISFNNGQPTPEEQRKIEDKIKAKFTGTDKAGQLVLTFSDSKDTAPTINPLLPNGFDKQFDTLNKTVQEEIFTGHKVTSPMLFGIKEAGQLGGRDELREAFELFQNGYLNAKQTVITDVFNDIFEIAGKGRPLSIIPTEPISEGINQDAVIGVMTQDEIREKAGLPKLNKPVTPQVAAMRMQFAKDKDPIAVFKSFGKSKSEFQIVKHNAEITTKEEAFLGEVSYYRDAFKKPSIQLDSLSRSILDLISKDKLIEPKAIANLLKKDLNDVMNKLKELVKRGLVQGDAGKDLTVDPEAEKILEENPATTESLEVMYSYEERKNVPPAKSGSREFCQHLMDLDKLYSREDIESISEIVGRDVWRDRGGWYHNPGTDKTTPYCRHVWSQVIVRKK